MSTLVTKNLQIGADGTASNNFTVYQPVSPDGTLRIGNGNSGTTSAQVVLTSAGNVGIGTSSPAQALELAAGRKIRVARPDNVRFTDIFTDGDGSVIQFAANDHLDVRSSAGTTMARFAHTGQQSSVIPGGSTLLLEFKCRAFVNFNGTGAMVINASGNVSSVTDNNTGDFTVNFTTAMPDANFAVGGNCLEETTANTRGDRLLTMFRTTPVAGSCRVSTIALSGVVVDMEKVYVVIFR